MTAEASEISQISSILRAWGQDLSGETSAGDQNTGGSYRASRRSTSLAYLASFLLSVLSTLLDIERAEELISSVRSTYRREGYLHGDIRDSEERE